MRLTAGRILRTLAGLGKSSDAISGSPGRPPVGSVPNCEISRLPGTLLPGLLLVIAATTGADVLAQSCPRGGKGCAAPTSAVQIQPRIYSSARSLAQPADATPAAACNLAGVWIETGSWGSAGVLTFGKDLVGQDAHPYCTMPHGASITMTGFNTFTEPESWGGGPECQSSVATMAFVSGTCDKVTGSYVNADGTGGVLNWIRKDAGKSLGAGCEDLNMSAGMPGQVCGDPINVTTGNVYEVVVDFAGTSSFPIPFRRHYNSLSRSIGALGHQWTHDFEAKVVTLTPTLIQVVRGSQKVFTYNLVNGQWLGDADLTSQLTQTVDGSGHATGWRYLTGGNLIEVYDSTGRLISVTEAGGASRALSYDSTGLLTQIADAYGRAITFAYDASRRLSVVMEPSGGRYVYQYDALGDLASVQRPGGTTERYLYENAAWPRFLTGILDENGARFSTWTYDADGNAIASEHAGGIGRVTISLDTPTGGVNTVTDPLGHGQSYQYYEIESLSRTASADLSGTGFPQKASWTYFANGNVESHTDYFGNMTCYGYELTRNFETIRVEGLPYTPDTCQNLSFYPQPPNARAISAAWHPKWRLRVKLAVPKRLTTYVYQGQPDPSNGGAPASCAPAGAVLPDGSPIAVLCKQIEQATTDVSGVQGLTPTLDLSVAARVRSFTYNGFGQPLSATDPRGNATQFSYYASSTVDHSFGDLQAVTNALGHVTRFTRYDGAGRLLQSIGATGSTVDTTYTARGWVRQISVTPSGGGTAQTTSFVYDGVGQPKVVALPDGTSILYGYDDARRLTSITDSAGNSVAYTLDNAGNRIGEQRKDPNGILARSITRTFDGLNHLQSVTGAAQ